MRFRGWNEELASSLEPGRLALPPRTVGGMGQPRMSSAGNLATLELVRILARRFTRD